MTIKDLASFLVIVILASGLAHQYKVTRDLKQEIEQVRGLIVHVVSSESAIPESEPVANPSEWNQVEELRKLSLKIVGIETTLDTLVRNQDAIVKKHNALLPLIDAMERSFEAEFQAINPMYRSPVFGTDLKAAELSQLGPVSGFSRAKSLY